LIAECLSKEEIARFTRFAKELGLEVLLEMHSDKQLEKISIENDIIGINNRDLTNFTVDIGSSIALSNQLPEKTLRIEENGINDVSVINRIKKSRVEGLLIGEVVMNIVSTYTA